jgi:hypothetical protein
MQAGAANPITSFSTPHSLPASVCSRWLLHISYRKYFWRRDQERGKFYDRTWLQEEREGKRGEEGPCHLPELLLLDGSRRSCETLQHLPCVADCRKHNPVRGGWFTDDSEVGGVIRLDLKKKFAAAPHHSNRGSHKQGGGGSGLPRRRKMPSRAFLAAVLLAFAMHGMGSKTPPSMPVVSSSTIKMVRQSAITPQTRAFHARPA